MNIKHKKYNIKKPTVKTLVNYKGITFYIYHGQPLIIKKSTYESYSDTEPIHILVQPDWLPNIIHAIEDKQNNIAVNNVEGVNINKEKCKNNKQNNVKSRKGNPRFTGFCFTISDYNNNDIDILMSLTYAKNYRIKHLICTPEIDKLGTNYIRGYLETINPISIASLTNKYLPRAFNTRRVVTEKNAWDFCDPESEKYKRLIEFGEKIKPISVPIIKIGGNFRKHN